MAGISSPQRMSYKLEKSPVRTVEPHVARNVSVQVVTESENLTPTGSRPPRWKA
jgi:hypothetical protein